MNFKHWIKKGFVSIEAVITGAIILSVGFVALSNMGVTGSTVVQNGLAKLDALGIFEEVQQEEPEEKALSLELVNTYFYDAWNFYQGDYESVEFGFETRIYGVVLKVRNTTETDYVIQSAKINYPWGPGIGFPEYVKNYNETNLVGLTLGELTEGVLFFDVFRDAPRVDTFRQEQVSLVLNFTNGETKTFNILGIPPAPPMPEGFPFEPGSYDSTLNISWSDVNPESDFTWVAIPGGIRITDYNSPVNDRMVVIPKTINGQPVLEVEGMDNMYLSSLALPNSITKIGNNAFDYSNLSSVIIPNSVTWIGDSAFAHNNLTNVKIPAGVTHLGSSVFYANEILQVQFFGPAPVEVGSNIFDSNENFFSGRGSLWVPAAYEADYLNLSGNFCIDSMMYRTFN